MFCWVLIRTCGFATCYLMDGTSNLCSKYSFSIHFSFSSWYKSSRYPSHLSAICAALVKFSPVADWIHCRRGWNFRVIDSNIWNSCHEFPFEFAASNSTHIPSSYCRLSTLELSLYFSLQFLISVLIFAFCFLFL